LFSKNGRPSFSQLFEIGRVLLRLDHVASRIVKRGSQHHVSGEVT
jgi:hypothetical protein